MAHDLGGLERKLHAVKEATTKFHEAAHADFMLQIIHFPGWTTLPELELVLAHVDDIQQRITGLHSGFDALVKAAKLIGHD